jgi:hypothetical protein
VSHSAIGPRNNELKSRDQLVEDYAMYLNSSVNTCTVNTDRRRKKNKKVQK